MMVTSSSAVRLFLAAMLFSCRFVSSFGECVCRRGFFKCNSTADCVAQDFMCDGRMDCPDQSDEWNCVDVSLKNFLDSKYRKRPDADREKKMLECDLQDVPLGCSCSRLSVFCDNRNLTELPKNVSKRTKEIDFSGNRIKHLNFHILPVLPNTTTLHLRNGVLEDIQRDAFRNLGLLENLYLISNRLEVLEKETFFSLKRLRNLLLSHNLLSILRPGAFQGLSELEELNLQHCLLEDLPLGVFDPLTKLKNLWLDSNQLTYLKPHLFKPLRNLQTLSLSKNELSQFPSEAVAGLWSLTSLSLDWNKLSRIEEHELVNISSLKILHLRSNHIESFHLKAFVHTPYLQSLYLVNNPFRKLPDGIFNVLPKLSHIYLPDFSMCSSAPCVRVCEPKSDGISSLDDLLDNVLLRMSVWVVASGSCLGNAFVLVNRFLMREPNEVHSFYIKNLSVADLLMGVYLFVIAFKDSQFRQDYIRHDKEWRHSWECQLSGAISTLSSEASVFIMAVITVDRYISITYPLALRRRTSKIAVSTMASAWLLASFIAFLPLSGSSYFTSHFYGHNALCLPLHIHDAFGQAWQYSLFVFCGLNSAVFLVIAIAYAKMFYTIVKSRLGLRSSQQKQDRTIAKRFAVIVFADFLCWCPIIVIKIVSLAGVQIDNTLYGWVAVFLLPVNAALNPVLYTLTTRLFKQHMARVIFTWNAPNLPPVPVDTSGISRSSIFYIRGSNRLHIATVSDSDSSLVPSSSRSCSGHRRNQTYRKITSYTKACNSCYY